MSQWQQGDAEVWREEEKRKKKEKEKETLWGRGGKKDGPGGCGGMATAVKPREVSLVLVFFVVGKRKRRRGGGQDNVRALFGVGAFWREKEERGEKKCVSFPGSGVITGDIENAASVAARQRY